MRFFLLVILLTAGITPLSANELEVEYQVESCQPTLAEEIIQEPSETIPTLSEFFRLVQKNYSSERTHSPSHPSLDWGLTFFQCKISSSYSPVVELCSIHRRIQTGIRANAP